MTTDNALALLAEALESLQGGLEDGGDLETEYSKHDRELCKRITALLDSGGWISVKDRLPEKMGSYLVVLCGGPHDLIPDIAYFYPDWEPNSKWATPRGCATVTHWQPLPPLPKGEIQ